MAISEDLRGIRAALDELAQGNEALVSLLCDNLESLADQVEALEDLPFSPHGMDGALSMCGTGVPFDHPGGLLQ